MRERVRHFLAGDTLKARAARSAALTIVNFGAQNVIRLASNLILTRLLFPEAFGLMALVQVVLTGLILFSELGSLEAVIQNERGSDPDFLNTVWVIAIGRGFLLWFGAIVLAIPMANFYDTPQLAEILPVAGLTVVFQGFNSTRILVADRNLAIGRLTLMSLGVQVLGILVMILMSWWLRSVWALVIGSLVQAFAAAVLSHLVLPGPPNRFAFERDAGRQLFHFGKYIFFSTIAGFFVNQSDRAILGRLVSLDELAVYNIGLMLATVPMLLVQGLASRIIFPLYARKPPSESPDARRKINQARRLATGGAFLGSAVLALGGILIVQILYDPRYHLAGPITALLSLSMLPRIITITYERLPLAAGHSGRFAIITIILAVLQLGTMLVGGQYFGLGGIAAAPAVATVVLYPVLVTLIRPYKGWDPLHDAVFFALFAGIAGLVFWLSGPELIRLFALS